ncbi:MAG: hypothetical protein ABSH10_07275 [Phycisphaerae bacterium]
MTKMTRRMMLMLAGLAVVLAAQISKAADPPPQTQGAERTRSAGGEGDRLVKEMGLTGDKAAKFRQLFGEYRQAITDWRNQNGSKAQDLRDQIRTATEAKDEAKAKELRSELKKLMADQLAIRDKLLTQLGDILTPDQIEMVKDVVVEWRARVWRILRDVNLTDDQKAKVHQILKSQPQDMESDNPPAQPGKAFQALMEKIVSGALLTDVQQKALAAMTGEGTFFDKVAKLDLTETQKTQIDKIKAAMERGAARATSRRSREPNAAQ